MSSREFIDQPLEEWERRSYYSLKWLKFLKFNFLRLIFLPIDIISNAA